MSDAVAIEHLDKTIATGFWGRKKQLLHDVSFHVPAGATVGFVGPNGAGKSTTIKHIIGASRPTSGKVTVFGGDPRSRSVRARLGYMPELPPLPPTLTPREMLRLHGTLCAEDASKRPSPATIDELLALVGLTSAADQRVGGFSKGMQTRLCLALALVHRPELLILDEPMSGLDPVGRQLVRRILHDQRAAGRTILFSSHVLGDVEALCDHVVVIRDGRVVYTGSTSDTVGALGTRWRVRVKTKDDQPPAAAGLDVIESKREGDTLVVVVDAKDAADAAIALRAAGATVLSLDPMRPSLEERMVSLLGGRTA